MPNFAAIGSDVLPILPATIGDFNIDTYLNSFSEDISFIVANNTVNEMNKIQKISYNHSAAVSNIKSNMEKYGLLLDVDSSNLPVLLTATVRPPFETFRQFRSPSNRKKELNFCVFTSQHCQQLKSSGWSEVVVEFISPQQDVISATILNGEICEEDITPDNVSQDINVEDVPALPSTTDYWTKWKRSESRSKWDFICWYEGGCKKWSSKDRADAGVNIKLYSSLKCTHEKLRDFIEEEGGKEKYTITKFEEYKFKSIKRKKTTDYPDNLSDARCLKKISYRNLSFSFKKSFWSYCMCLLYRRNNTVSIATFFE